MKTGVFKNECQSKDLSRNGFLNNSAWFKK